MNDLALLENQQTITSLEVAEMVEKEHSNLMKDIRRYIQKSAEVKIDLGDFFIESTYLDANNQSRPCYEVTKKGCEFIANKLTGVKGVAFTARYINRFHDMEDYIKQNDNKNSIENGLIAAKFIADDMRVNDASRLLMYENLCKDFNIPTGFLPKYEHNGSREMKAPSHLLKENNCSLKAAKFNLLLIEHGYLEEKERPSSKGGIKKYKRLTEKGLRYGENAVSPHNQKEVQPLYYVDTFMELYQAVIQ